MKALALLLLLAACAPRAQVVRGEPAPEPEPIPETTPVPEPTPLPEPTLSDLALVAAPAPRWLASLVEGAVPSPPSLELLSSRPNQVTDTGVCFAAHGTPAVWPNPARRDHHDEPPGNLPASLHGYGLVQAIQQGAHAFGFYGINWGGGPLLAITTDGEPRAVYDFSAWTRAPEVLPGDEAFVEQWPTWAAIQDGVLFVSTAHRTYAKSSGGINAQIAAIDLASHTLLWRSQPLVANAANFVPVGEHLISGYGFTAEPDYLYILEQATGRVVSRTKVKSGPEWLLTDGETLEVRCYNTDYTFAIR